MEIRIFRISCRPIKSLCSLFAMACTILAVMTTTAAIGDDVIPPYQVAGEHRVNDFSEAFDYRDQEGDIVDLETDTTLRPLPIELGRLDQIWSYGDPTGRVRAWVNSKGGDTDKYASYLQNPDSVSKTIDLWSYPAYQSELYWYKTFTKGSPDSKATAVILPSYVQLGYTAMPTPSGSDSWRNPAATINISICAFPVNSDGEECELVPGPDVERLSFYNVAQLGTDHPLNGGYPDSYHYRTWGVLPGETPTVADNGIPSSISHVQNDRYRLDLSRYVHSIDLSHIQDGEEYVVLYELYAEGGSYADGGRMTAAIGDPLDTSNDDGIKLITTDAPYLNPLPRKCTEAYDQQRFTANQDGTVNDAYTGLMWQRCPLGYSFNNGGTVADLTDDSCTADLSTTQLQDWQGALQTAQADTLAGYSDWRVPNIKELESLVADCLGIMIEPQPFPNTPANQRFWSSTPDNKDINGSGSAWQVSFLNGDVDVAKRETNGYLRLVRDSGVDPIAPLPKLIAEGVSLKEGDSGSAQALYRVTLTRAANENVTVDYTLLSPNNQATNGVDFDQTSGSLTFLPGETSKEVAVTIYGDTEVEVNERLYLMLSNASANVHLARPTGIGFIVDDEPVITMGRPYEAEEGNTGDNLQAQIQVVLDKPAAAPVTVDYSLAGDTATIGSDLVNASGTLSFSIGDDAAIISVDIIGDELRENDERFNIVLANPVGARLQPGVGDTITLPVILVDDDGPGTYAALNDTGIQSCANDTQIALACPQVGFPVQDAEIGRDADPATNDDQDGKAGFSFTKLDDTGTPLTDQSLYNPDPWSCVRDEITGLTWEVKLDTPSQLHLPDHTYSWYNSTGINDGGMSGTENGGFSCADSVNCDTEKYVAAVNAENFCGFSDWRLPTIEELFTLVHANSILWNHDYVGSAANSFFPYMSLEGYNGLWSATPMLYEDDSSYSYAWTLTATGIKQDSKARGNRIRLVRGGN